MERQEVTRAEEDLSSEQGNDWLRQNKYLYIYTRRDFVYKLSNKESVYGIKCSPLTYLSSKLEESPVEDCVTLVLVIITLFIVCLLFVSRVYCLQAGRAGSCSFTSARVVCRLATVCGRRVWPGPVWPVWSCRVWGERGPGAGTSDRDTGTGAASEVTRELRGDLGQVMRRLGTLGDRGELQWWQGMRDTSPVSGIMIWLTDSSSMRGSRAQETASEDGERLRLSQGSWHDWDWGQDTGHLIIRYSDQWEDTGPPGLNYI